MVESLFQLQNSDGYDSASSMSNASAAVAQQVQPAANANAPVQNLVRDENSLTWVGISPVAEKTQEAKERTTKFVHNIRAMV